MSFVATRCLTVLLVLAGLLATLSACAADSAYDQQRLQRTLRERQLDLELRRQQELPTQAPLATPQGQTLSNWQRQQQEQRTLHERQRQELDTYPVDYWLKLDRPAQAREQEAQDLDFKLERPLVEQQLVPPSERATPDPSEFTPIH